MLMFFGGKILTWFFFIILACSVRCCESVVAGGVVWFVRGMGRVARSGEVVMGYAVMMI